MNKRPKTSRKRISPPGGDSQAVHGPELAPHLSAHQDSGLHEPPHDPNASTAPVHPVTDDMMEHAAHRAAEQADGVAHHTIPPVAVHGHPGETPADAAPDTAFVVGAEATVAETAPYVPALDDPAIGAEPVSASVAAEVEDAVEPSSRTLVESGSDASAALDLYNAKVLDMMRAHMAATSAHMAALFQAKSVPEAVALNANHLRRQIEVLTTQGRELTLLAQTLTLQALQPLKGLIAPNR